MLQEDGSLDLDWFRDKIIELADTPEMAKAFTQELALTDWHDLGKCSLCSKMTERTKLTLVEKDTAFRDKMLCSKCMQLIRNTKPRDCAICEEWYGDHCYAWGDKDLCFKCCQKYKSEIMRVHSHLERTSNLGLTSNLTAKQWLSALEHFKWRCAYSSKHKFENLEHYLPVSLGGGTIASNCVPSCFRCNAKKHDCHPDKLDRLFPPDNLARIRAYLQSQTA